MNERELIRTAFAKIHASDGVEKEILAMKKQSNIRFLRPVAAAALCACLLVGSAFAVNTATGGELFQSIRTVFGVQEVQMETVYVDDNVSLTLFGMEGQPDLPEDAVSWAAFGEDAGAYLTADGRVMLREQGQADRDVTEAWIDGYTFTAGGKDITVETVTDGSGNVAYRCKAPVGDDLEEALLAGGWLFDGDKFDLSLLLGDGVQVCYEGEPREDGGEARVYTFSFAEMEEILSRK